MHSAEELAGTAHDSDSRDSAVGLALDLALAQAEVPQEARWVTVEIDGLGSQRVPCAR